MIQAILWLCTQGRSAPWIHTDEGDDDMPGHVKCSMFGASLNVPITKGRLNLGTWQVKHFDAQHFNRYAHLVPAVTLVSRGLAPLA